MAQRRSRRKADRWRRAWGWLRGRASPSGTWLVMPLMVVVVIAVLFGRAEPAAATYSRRVILDAIRFVESSGMAQPPDGDGGRAIGPYQIHEPYWRDAVAHDESLGGGYQNCRNAAYAERVIDAYMRRWAAAAWQVGDAEVIAKVHNGGPRGPDKRATEPYWQRVSARLPQR